MKLRSLPISTPMATTLRNGESVRLRALDHEDGERLATFYTSIPDKDRRSYGTSHPLTHEEAIRDAAFASDPLSVSLVLTSDTDEIVGLAWFRWRNPESQASGCGVCIRHDYQGIGAGKVLMKELLEVARSVGPQHMRSSVLQENPHAVELYRKMGFDVVSTGTVQGSSGPATEMRYWMERSTR